MTPPAIPPALRPILRPARPDDAPAIAAFHVRQWRDAYRDLAPPAAYAALDEARRLPYWRAALAEAPPTGTLLAGTGSTIAGLATYGAGTGALAGHGEIRHLYVDADQRGTGLGRLLLTRAQTALRNAGFPSVALAVVAGNHSARAFYRAMGGVETGTFTDPGPLWRSDNILVVWA